MSEKVKTIFADTFYSLALLGSRDSAHQRAIDFAKQHTGGLVTTAWVLTEVADALSAPEKRDRIPGLTHI
jgi:hypothetical protein